MLIVTTETFPGKNILAVNGVAIGSTIRAKNIGKDIGASLKSIVGGELVSYTHLLSEARDEAIQRMIAHAQSMGANAVVNLRLTTSQVTQGAAEILAYGTAVTLD